MRKPLSRPFKVECGKKAFKPTLAVDLKAFRLMEGIRLSDDIFGGLGQAPFAQIR